MNKAKQALIAMAELYDRKVSGAAITMMAQDLSDLPEEDIICALAKYRKDPTVRGFPTVGQIRGMVRPEVSDDGKAREIASLIAMCQGKFGSHRHEEARAYMGDIAWSVVVLEGGWQALCENTITEQLPILKSQWRELARAALQRHASGLPLLGLAPKQIMHESIKAVVLAAEKTKVNQEEK